MVSQGSSLKKPVRAAMDGEISALPLVSMAQAGVRESSHWRVRGLTFDIDPGEIVTLLGPNGSGKSSTAKLALGIIDPTEGSVTRAPDLHIGYVPQKLAIDWTFPLPVKRLMQLTGRLHPKQIEEALERTGVAHLLHKQVQNLSGGEFQRVLLARAIARKPNLLILDEPVQGVDFNGQIVLYELIASLRDELKCGILLISHDLHLVMAATDKVICLNGHMCCHGSPKAVSQMKEYRELFGGRAAEALAIYEHQHDHEHLPDGRVRHADGTITDHCPADTPQKSDGHSHVG